MILDKKFYERETVTVAKQLIGKTLTRNYMKEYRSRPYVKAKYHDYYIKNKDVVSVRSSIDGREYRIADSPDRQEAADLLADVNRDIIKFVDYLRNNPDEHIQRICNRYNPDKLGENLEYKSYKAYSVNKGQEIVICIRNKDGKLVTASELFDDLDKVKKQRFLPFDMAKDLIDDGMPKLQVVKLLLKHYKSELQD